MTANDHLFYAPPAPGRFTWAPWVASLSIVALFVTSIMPVGAGPPIENKLFPILTHQAIPAVSVTRANHSLCWTWDRDKERAPAVLDLDVTLDTADGDLFSPEIYRAATGEPWHTGGALPPGHYSTQFCTTIPASIPSTTPVRLRQVLTYQGFLGLWRIRVPLPELIAN